MLEEIDFVTYQFKFNEKATILDFLNVLDESGLIITDEDLIEDTLNNYNLSFDTFLRDIPSKLSNTEEVDKQ